MNHDLLPPPHKMWVHAQFWCMGTMHLDAFATGFYFTALAHSEDDPVIPGEVCLEIAGSTRRLRRVADDLYPELATWGDRGLRLNEWAEPTARWRRYGRSTHTAPMVKVARVLLPEGKRAPLPPGVRRDVIERDERICGLCGQLVPEGAPLDIDHILPVARGGLDDLDNLQVSHATCNRRKGARV